MSSTSLSPEAARAKMAQVDEIMSHAQRCVTNIENACGAMVGSSWQGNQAIKFSQRMQQLTTDCNSVLKTMQHVAETGKQHMATFVNADAE